MDHRLIHTRLEADPATEQYVCRLRRSSSIAHAVTAHRLLRSFGVEDTDRMRQRQRSERLHQSTQRAALRERGITADTALQLARYSRTSERFSLKLQSRWELERDRLADTLDRIEPLATA